MNQINRFLEGIKKLKSYFLYKNTEWTFPTMNIRILNDKDKGFSIVPLKSNEEEFSIKGAFGYAVIGAKEYNGVIYIVSNQILNNKSEIGVFPSPEIWSSSPQEYERTYKALHNFDDGTGIGDLNTDLFNHDTFNEIEIIIKEIRDGSVNLYLADYKNPNIVINSGFIQETGALTGSYMDVSSFDGSLNLIPTTSKRLEADFIGLDSGGRIRPGMYYMYFRYVDAFFNRTFFTGEVYPIQANYSGDGGSITGDIEFDIDGNPIYLDSKILIEFDISTIDTSFEYIEIAIIRYSADELGTPITDVSLINKLYRINDILSNNVLEYLGTEELSTLSIDEIVTENLAFVNASKTHTIVDSRYYGGNWKGNEYNTTTLAEYAKLITTRYVLGNRLDDHEAFLPGRGNFNEYQNKINEINKGSTTYDFSGYVRGEIVPFAVKFFFTDGSFSDAFPVEGGDELIISSFIPESSLGGNIKGLYRFPDISTANDITDPLLRDIQYPLGVKFDNTAAIVYYNANIDLMKDIVGFMYVRADRIENLIYQGLVMPLLESIQDNYGPLIGSNLQTKVPYFSSKYELPLEFIGIDTSVPGIRYVDGTEKLSSRFGFKGTGSLDKFALISPDYLFSTNNKIADNTKVYIKVTSKYSDLTNSLVELKSGCYNPSPKYIDINNDAYTLPKVYTDKLYSNVSLIHINSGSYNVNGEYSSLLPDNTNNVNSLFYETDPPTNSKLYNRSMNYCRYIVLELDNDQPENGQFLNNSMVNIYLSENNAQFYIDTRTSFVVSTKNYREISKLIKVDVNSSTLKIFKGDVFVSRSIFRLFKPFGSDGLDDYIIDPTRPPCGLMDPNNTTENWANNYYNHGLMLSILSENFSNVDMRNKVQAIDPSNPSNSFEYTFYPKLIKDGEDLFDWASDAIIQEYLIEAFQLNNGSNQIGNGKTVIGYDSERTIDKNKYITRIYFSSKSINGELSDAFKQIGQLSFQDYDLSFGAIIKLIEYNGQLISIQESRISKHFLGQQKLIPENISSDIVLENSGIYLNDKTQPLSFFGSQHQQSITKGEDGYYGIDFNKRIIWQISTSENGMFAKDISTSNGISDWVEEIFDYYSERSDIISKLDDNPVNDNGIVSGYNRRFKEVYFTFHLKKIVDEQETIIRRTLIYSELIGQFIGEASFFPSRYITLNNDFFSFRTIGSGGAERGYLHDLPNAVPEYLDFYGSSNIMQFSIIVNGGQDAIGIIKEFSSYIITSNNNNFAKIEFETDYQSSELNPFIITDWTKEYIKPEYREGRWYGSIPINSKDLTPFSKDEFIKGNYLKLIFTFDKQDYIYINEMITNFIKSSI